MQLRFILAAALILTLAPTVQAHTVLYRADLSGPAESPPNGSPGIGTAIVEYDVDGHTLLFNVTFSGLEAGTTVAHIHCCTADPGLLTAGVAVTQGTLLGFPASVTSGSYTNVVLDLTSAASYGNTFLAANGASPASAEAALIAGMDSGRAYFNIHSSKYLGGEIRGFFSIVPEPGTAALVLLGLGTLAARTQRRLARSR